MYFVVKAPSQIRRNFCYYTEIVDACRTAAWLYERGIFSPSEYDSVIHSDPSAQSGKVLRLLEKKEETHPDIMKNILEQSHLQKQRALQSDIAVRHDGYLHGSIDERPRKVTVDRTQLHDRAAAASQPKAAAALPDFHHRTSNGSSPSSNTRLALQLNNLDKAGSNSPHEDRSPGSQRPTSVLARGRVDQDDLIETSASLRFESFSNQLPVAVSSPVTRSYTELQGQLAFPRAEPPVPQAGVSRLEASGPVAVFRRATETVEPATSAESKDNEPEVCNVTECNSAFPSNHPSVLHASYSLAETVNTMSSVFHLCFMIMLKH